MAVGCNDTAEITDDDGGVYHDGTYIDEFLHDHRVEYFDLQGEMVSAQHYTDCDPSGAGTDTGVSRAYVTLSTAPASPTE